MKARNRTTVDWIAINFALGLLNTVIYFKSGSDINLVVATALFCAVVYLVLD